MSSQTLSAPSLPSLDVTDPTVVMCYDILAFAPLAEMFDYTDGKYLGNYGSDRASYVRAQETQAAYLLDQVNCAKESKLLDIGCGHGRLLKTAMRCGADAVGITISPPQVRYGSFHGLDIRLMDYRKIPAEWDGTFSCIVANGSLEHFVQVADAMANHADDIYRQMFAICHRLINKGDRLATTAIHFREQNQVDPAAISRGHQSFRKGSDEYHFALLFLKTFGDWYPEPGQLARCANGLFKLIEEEDGTRDYHETSEYWLHHMFRGLRTNPRIWWFVTRHLLTNRRPAWDMICCLLIDQSWMWQFRGANPPTRLYRHTWEAI